MIQKVILEMIVREVPREKQTEAFEYSREVYANMPTGRFLQEPHYSIFMSGKWSNVYDMVYRKYVKDLK